MAIAHSSPMGDGDPSRQDSFRTEQLKLVTPEPTDLSVDSKFDGAIYVANASLLGGKPGGLVRVLLPGFLAQAEETNCTVIRPIPTELTEETFFAEGSPRRIDRSVISVGEKGRTVDELKLHVSREEYLSYYGIDANAVKWFLLHADAKSAGHWDTGARAQSHNVMTELASVIVKQIYDQKLKDPVVVLHDYQLDLLPLKIGAAWKYFLSKLPEKEREQLPSRIPIARFGHTPEMTSKTLNEYVAIQKKTAPKDPTTQWQDLPTKRHFHDYMKRLFACDLVGCQTVKDANAILKMAKEFGYRVIADKGLVWAPDASGKNRFARVAAFPVSVDVNVIENDARNVEANAAVGTLMHNAKFEGLRVVAAVQRRDTTKNIPGQIEAFATLLRDHPELRGKVGFFLVACDTRNDVAGDIYPVLTKQVEEAVKKVNDEFIALGYDAPIYYQRKAMTSMEVSALYSRPEVICAMALSELDGQVLVGHEFHSAKREGGLGRFIVTRGCGASYAFENFGSVVIEDFKQTHQISEAMFAVLTDSEENLAGYQKLGRKYLEKYSAQHQNEAILKATKLAAKNRFNTRQEGISVGQYLPY